MCQGEIASKSGLRQATPLLSPGGAILLSRKRDQKSGPLRGLDLFERCNLRAAFPAHSRVVTYSRRSPWGRSPDLSFHPLGRPSEPAGSLTLAD